MAKILSDNGYILGITDIKSFESLSKEFVGNHFFQTMDLAKPEQEMQGLKSLILKMDGVYLIILNAGVRFEDSSLDWDKEDTIIAINVRGVPALGFS